MNEFIIYLLHYTPLKFKGGILVPALPRSVSEPISANVGGAYDNWAHMGEQGCFERTIDPERYPPIKK